MPKTPEKNRRIGVKAVIALALGGLAAGVLVDRAHDDQLEANKPNTPALSALPEPIPQPEVVQNQTRKEIKKRIEPVQVHVGEEVLTEADKIADELINDLCIQEETDADKIRHAMGQGYTKVDAYIEGTLMLMNGDERMNLNLSMKAGCGAQKLADLHNAGKDADVIKEFEVDRLRHLLDSNGMGFAADRWIADIEELKEDLSNADSEEEKSKIACDYVRNKPAHLGDYLKGSDLFDKSRDPGFRKELGSLGWEVFWATLNAYSIRLGQEHFFRECHGMERVDDKE